MTTFTSNFIMYYGKFSGPSYAGGVKLATGENITKVHTAVKPVDYMDSLAKQHDINYQYFERRSIGVRSWLRQGNVAQSSGCESRLGNC